MIPIIDTHVHLGIDYWLHSHGRNDLVHESSYRDVITVSTNLKEKGIRLVGIGAIPWPSAAPDTSGYATYGKENEWLVEELSGQLAVAFIGVNPHSKLSIGRAEEIAQASREIVRGVKIHPILTQTDLPWLATQQDFFAMLRHNRLATLVHVCSGREHLIGRIDRPIAATPKDCLDLAECYPDNEFIFDHCLRLSESSLQRVHDYPNVFVDTAALSCQLNWSEKSDINIYPSSDSHLGEMKPVQIWEYLVNELRLSDRLMYGSDYPYTLWWATSYWDELEPLWSSNISAEARHRVAFANAHQMLFQERKF